MPTVQTDTDLVLQHQNYVKALARQIHQKLPACVEYDDLVQYGQIGLLEAAAGFDDARGVPFKTFAYTRIRGAIFDGLARLRGVPRSIAAKERTGHAELRRECVRQQSIADVCEQLAAQTQPLADFDTLAGQFRAAVQQIGLACALAQMPDGQVPEPVAEDDPPQQAALAELAGRLRELVGTLPADQASIVRTHYFEGRSLTECAAALGKHKAWISRLHTRALEALRVALGEAADDADAGND